MSGEAENKSVVKKFGSGTREVPANKASKWYPAEDEPIPKKASLISPKANPSMISPSHLRDSLPLAVRKNQKPTTLRPSLVPGAILIILAGRFRGKRVVYLKPLTDGVLLVTGPFKINGVPLRRVNARYVIATSTSVDLSGVKGLDKIDQTYFSRAKEAAKSKEEKFYEGGAKPKKKPVPEVRKADQKEIDNSIVKAVKQTPHLSAYLASSFSLSKGDRPHLMKF